MRILVSICLWLALCVTPALSQTLEDLATQLPEGSFNERSEVVAAIAATGDPRAAVRHADDALYQAKRSGKNQVAIGAQAHRPQAQARAA